MSATTTRRIEDATPAHAATDWKMAALAIAAAVGMVWWFKLSLDFDVNAPSFNPAVFVPVVLALYGVLQAVTYLRGRSLGSRFGVSAFEMLGHTVDTGSTLRGRVLTSRDLHSPGGFRLRLQCIEEVATPTTRATRAPGAAIASSGSRTTPCSRPGRVRAACQWSSPFPPLRPTSSRPATASAGSSKSRRWRMGRATKRSLGYRSRAPRPERPGAARWLRIAASTAS